jgi:hypothetical protein
VHFAGQELGFYRWQRIARNFRFLATNSPENFALANDKDINCWFGELELRTAKRTKYPSALKLSVKGEYSESQKQHHDSWKSASICISKIDDCVQRFQRCRAGDSLNSHSQACGWRTYPRVVAGSNKRFREIGDPGEFRLGDDEEFRS